MENSNDKKPRVGFGIMILKDNKVLLGKRNSDPEKAGSLLHGEGTWTMPGGKLRFREDIKEACLRETMEETSITLEKNSLKLISLTNDLVHDAHFITLGFLCHKFSGEAAVMEPEEITEWQWFDLNNLPSPIFFPSEEILEKYSGLVRETNQLL